MINKMKNAGLIAVFVLSSCVMAADHNEQEGGDANAIQIVEQAAAPEANAPRYQLTDGERQIIRAFSESIRDNVRQLGLFGVRLGGIVVGAIDAFRPLPEGYHAQTEVMLVNFFQARVTDHERGIAGYLGNHAVGAVNYIPGGNYITHYTVNEEGQGVTERLINAFGTFYLQYAQRAAPQNPA